MEKLLVNEIIIRLVFFAGILLIMAAWEVLAPRRVLTRSQATRWANNLALTIFNTLLVRLIFPVAAVGVALSATDKGWGLLNWLVLPD